MESTSTNGVRLTDGENRFLFSLGICVGASTLSYTELQNDNGKISILASESLPHNGSPREVLRRLLTEKSYSRHSLIVTGRKFKDIFSAHSIAEPQAVEAALRFLYPTENFDAIASLGAENFMVYSINTEGCIDTVVTGNKCASGTGEFFLQQTGRMNLSLEEAIASAQDQEPYPVSGRCSVFCKSDCTHALNKGVPLGRVSAGLCEMIADKILELLKKLEPERVLIIGGVTRIGSVVDFIKRDFPSAVIPPEASSFEALGAALTAFHVDAPFPETIVFNDNTNKYPTLPPLAEAFSRVHFKSLTKSKPAEGDRCVLGIDIGSTTTKAALIRVSDNALLASCYLRTNGAPVKASIECYASIAEQVTVPIEIIGLGTTGSGRHIAALHALTEGVVNEIIAHAVAAAFFDPEVDTIFEIGGQDAKYTFLVNSVAADYAMNEACSAGTGSFLEESAKESLHITYTDIGSIALTAAAPLNFNDQCAAFISSDIKNAGNLNYSREDIVAGLVYSICMNYLNRVKGNRQVGKKIFMQGGVCYNQAVPAAMAELTGKDIIVPPEPGLMGAYGVALEIKKRIELGLLKEQTFELNELIARPFSLVNDFICAGGAEKCDRKCSVSVISVDGKKYPFGGACSKYYNERKHIRTNPENYNWVAQRQDLVYRLAQESAPAVPQRRKRIGISRSFMTNSLYPLFHTYFDSLGMEIVLAKEASLAGQEKTNSSFCYPVELSHGFFEDLLSQKPDVLFIPQISHFGSDENPAHNKLCVFAQAESYYLKSAFKDEIKIPLLNPVIDFTAPVKKRRSVFRSIARSLGCSASLSDKAYAKAEEAQQKVFDRFKELGKEALAQLEADPDAFGLVLFGRSYNAFAGEANLNIPHKCAAKNVAIIPFDFLPLTDEESFPNMYWYSGAMLLKAARFVKKHPQLFGVFVSNFSCGPDSFIIPYFRTIMESKPSLTLELDSHSADVGIDTRIDAVLDIIRNYRSLKDASNFSEHAVPFRPLSYETKNGKTVVTDSSGKQFSLQSPEIEVVIPSMGGIGTDAFAASLRAFGINSYALPVPTEETLKCGKAETTCKECLPYILSSGQMTRHISHDRKAGMKTLFFMPHGHGPCRQGQYFIALQETIKRLELKDAGVLTLDDETAYSGFGEDFFKHAWITICISDAVTEIKDALFSLAKNRDSALKELAEAWSIFLPALAQKNIETIFTGLASLVERIGKIPVHTPLHKAKIIALIGEIYVRQEEFSRVDLQDTLAKHGFVLRTAPVTEYIYYCNFLLKKGIASQPVSFLERLKLYIKDSVMVRLEKRIRTSLAQTGLCTHETVDIEKTYRFAKHLIPEQLMGESILTVGLALREIIDSVCGVISIGPFNCMPSRVAEAILSVEMNYEGKAEASGKGGNITHNSSASLPFLSLETDGNPYPQIIQSKIEIFMMQAERLFQTMQKNTPIAPAVSGISSHQPILTADATESPLLFSPELQNGDIQLIEENLRIDPQSSSGQS